MPGLLPRWPGWASFRQSRAIVSPRSPGPKVLGGGRPVGELEPTVDLQWA